MIINIKNLETSFVNLVNSTFTWIEKYLVPVLIYLNAGLLFLLIFRNIF